MTLLQLIQQRQEEFDKQFYERGKHNTQTLISILEHIIEEGEKAIQEERFAGTPYAVNKLLAPLKATVETLKKKV